MQERKMILFLDQLLELFQTNLNFTKERQGEEDIHQLRLAIKKIKIFLALIEFATEKEFQKKEHNSFFKPLFKKAGAHRDAQINQNLVINENAAIFSEYKEYLRKKQQTASLELLNQINDFNHTRFEELNKVLHQNIQTLTNEAISTASSSYILKKWGKIQVLIPYMYDGKELHKIRINLRAIHEVLGMLNFINPTPKLFDFQTEVKSLNDLIGEWHDYYELALSIADFMDINMNNPELEKFVEKSNQENLLRALEIKNTLNKYIAEKKFKILECIPI